MSSITMSPRYSVPSDGPAVKVRRSPQAVGPVRLTRRGRIVVMAVFLGLALAVMVGLGGWATATRDAGTPEPVRVVEVQPGDTLYGIAGEIAGPGEVREMVHRIRQLNALPSGGLQAGQKLAVPVG